MGGGGQSGGTTTTNTTPWSGQQPYLTAGFTQAQNILNGNQPQYYPGSTVAGQSPNTQSAYNMMAQTTQNNPLQAASQQQVGNTINGNYLNSNPYLDATFNTGASQIANSYNQTVNGQNSGFEKGGRYGSGMQAYYKNQADNTLGQNLQQYAANTYNQNYQNERTNQLNAATSGSGAVQNQGIANANALGTVGSAQDQYAQNLVDANVNQWNYNQNLPQNKLQNYMGIIQGNYGGQSSTTVPTSGSNTLGNILGAGLGAASLFKFSDRRLKRNIERIGTAPNGLGIYSYQYEGIRMPMVGFMADEVEKIHPEAVTTHASGYKMVRYELAGAA